MRKITAKKNNKKRNTTIVSLLLIILMFFSILGYSFRGSGNDSNSEKITYNGFEFVKRNDLWFVEKEGTIFAFENNPNEVNESNVNLNKINNYYNKPLYISSDSDEATLEISRNFYQIVQRIQPACLDGKVCEGDLPTKTCEDNFIIIREKEIGNITQEDNCIFIEGKKENLVKLADEFLFKTLNIRQ